MQLVIVDDSAQIRDTLKRLVSTFDDVHVIADAENVQEAIEKIVNTKPDVAILDFKLPDGSAVDIINAMKEKDIDSKIIVFTLFDSQQVIDACKKAGASYVFSKSKDIIKLKTTLLALKNGNQ